MTKAIFLDGLILHGTRIIVRCVISSYEEQNVYNPFPTQVSLSAGDLPEVRDVVVRRVKALNLQQEGSSPETPRS